MKNLYSYESVERFISEKLIPEGYEIETIPGTLVDSYVCIAPDSEHYNFIFREKYINEWQTGLEARRCIKLTKWAEDALRSAREQEEAVA